MIPVPSCNDRHTGVVASEHAVHIWKVNLDRQAYQAAFFYDMLSHDEHKRAARYPFEVHRRRFIIARGILRLLLSGYLCTQPQKILFGYGPTGKPEVVSPAAQIRFNLSHSGSVALFAVSRVHEVGIDIETLRRDFDIAAITDLVFTARERVVFANCTEDRKVAAFLRGWTRKEACLKAIGAGLHFPIKQIEVPFEAALNAFPIDIDTGHDDVYSPVPLHLYTLEACSKHESALAVAGDPVSIVMNTWPDRIDSMNRDIECLRDRYHDEKTTVNAH
ncbi:MAG: 4'-phosphopantetheinyl transferase superfamily protein [Bryobacterales bacterium]